MMTEHGVSPELLDALAASTPDWLEANQAVENWVMAALVAVILAAAAGYIGLWRLKRWGRTLTLWATALGYLVSPMLGPMVFGPWELMFYEMSTLMLGAILAIAYMSPAAERFLPVHTPSQAAA